VAQRSGRVIGSCELSVGSDSVDISRLEVSVVSGLSLSVSTKADLPGALSVVVTKTNLMYHRYQVSALNLLFDLLSALTVKRLLTCNDGLSAYYK